MLTKDELQAIHDSTASGIIGLLRLYEKHAEVEVTSAVIIRTMDGWATTILPKNSPERKPE